MDIDIATLPQGTEIIVKPMADKTLLGRSGCFPLRPLDGDDELWI